MKVGDSIHAKKTSSRDSFIEAVIEDHCDAVIKGLADGRDPNNPDEFGWIPLHRAAANNSVKAANALASGFLTDCERY